VLPWTFGRGSASFLVHQSRGAGPAGLSILMMARLHLGWPGGFASGPADSRISWAAGVNPGTSLAGPNFPFGRRGAGKYPGRIWGVPGS